MCDFGLRVSALAQRSTSFAKDQTVNTLALGELCVPVMPAALLLWPGSRRGWSLEGWVRPCSRKTQTKRTCQPWDLARGLKDGVQWGRFLDGRWGLSGRLSRCFWRCALQR